jgi:hypothetical protein
VAFPAPANVLLFLTGRLGEGLAGELVASLDGEEAAERLVEGLAGEDRGLDGEERTGEPGFADAFVGECLAICIKLVAFFTKVGQTRSKT